MFRCMFSLFIICLIAPAAYTQRDIEKEEIRIEKKTGLAPRRDPPRGLKRAKTPGNGVLFVLTEPPTANITIKNNRGGESKQYQSQEGELRAELPPGTYDIDVTAANFYPPTDPRLKGVVIRPSLSITLRAYLKPTMGSIIIGPIEPDASILLDKRKPADLNLKVNIKKEEKQIELENVAEGYHTLSITVPNHVEWEREKVKVEGGARSIITPSLQPAVVKFIVKSEAGATIFIDGNNVGRTQENGVLKVSNDYKPGPHTIRAEVEDRFEPNQVSGDFETGERSVEVALTRIKPSSEYSEPFDPATFKGFWDAPQIWQVVPGKAAVKGIDPGLLKERRYDDFRMVFDISFINGKGAAWIVRARDRQNYYLFQLTGPRSISPNYFRSYLYQNGQIKMLDSVKVVENLNTPGDSFTIMVEADGTTIKHFIKLKSAPALGFQPMHTFGDKTLPYGMVGFQAKEDEEFNVYTMIVMPGKPKPPPTR